MQATVTTFSERMSESLRRVLAGRISHPVTLLVGSTAIVQLSTVLVAPVLTRLYTPADVGVLGVFTAFVATTAIAASGRYDVAVVSARDRADAARLTLAGVVLTLPLTLLFSVILVVFIRYQLLGFHALPMRAVPIVALALLATSVFTTLRYWNLRESSFGMISKISIYQGTSRSVAQVVLGFLGGGAFGLLLGEVVGRLVGVGRMIRDAVGPLGREFQPWTLRSIMRSITGAMSRYRDFPLYSLPSSLIDVAALQLPIPLLALFFGVGSAGEFTLVQRLFAAPLSLIGVAVADVFHSRAATYAREEPAQLREFYLRTGRWLFLTGVGPIALVAVLAPATFGWIFGSKWVEVGVLATILAPVALAQLSVSPLSRIVLLMKKGLRLKLFFDLLTLAMVVGVLVGCHRLGLSFRQTLIFFSAAQVLDFALYFLLMLRFISSIEEEAR